MKALSGKAYTLCAGTDFDVVEFYSFGQRTNFMQSKLSFRKIQRVLHNRNKNVSVDCMVAIKILKHFKLQWKWDTLHRMPKWLFI